MKKNLICDVGPTLLFFTVERFANCGLRDSAWKAEGSNSGDFRRTLEVRDIYNVSHPAPSAQLGTAVQDRDLWGPTAKLSGQSQ